MVNLDLQLLWSDKLLGKSHDVIDTESKRKRKQMERGITYGATVNITSPDARHLCQN